MQYFEVQAFEQNIFSFKNKVLFFSRSAFTKVKNSRKNILIEFIPGYFAIKIK